MAGYDVTSTTSFSRLHRFFTLLYFKIYHAIRGGRNSQQPPSSSTIRHEENCIRIQEKKPQKNHDTSVFRKIAEISSQVELQERRRLNTV